MPPVSKIDEMMAGPGDVPLDTVGQPVEADISAIGPEIQSFQEALCTFTASFEVLFSTQDNHHEDVTRLRGLIGWYAELYQQLQLRMSKAFIANLKDFLSNYLELDAELFQENVEYIVQTAKEYCEQAEFVKSLHLTLYDDINIIAQDAAVSLQKLELEAKAQEAEAKAARKDAHLAAGSRVGAAVVTSGATVVGASTVAGGILCIVTTASLGAILLPAAATAGACGLMGVSVDRYFKKKQVAARTTRIAANENFKNAKLAADTISGTILTCINDFTNAIQKATQYFCRVATSAIEFHEGTKKADAASKTANMSRLKMHIAKMKRPAHELFELCSDFQAVLPLIESEMARLKLEVAKHNTSYIQDWLAAREQKLDLARVIGDSTGWKLLEDTCPAVKVPEEVYTEIVMDNTHGTGVMTKIVTMEQVLATHADSSASETYTDEHNTTTKLGMEANIRIVPGVKLQPSAAAAFENKLKHSNTHSNGTSNQSSNKMSEAVTLVAAAGTAVKYRLTVRDNGDFITKAVPM